MILNIAALLFVLGATFINSIFGLYSGLINVFCAVVAMCVSLGYWEVLNDMLTGQAHLHPGYTEAFSIALLYCVTLFVLRFLADRFIRGNVKVPMYLDWGGGAACGFVLAQITVGIMMLSFLMLPFGGQAGLYSHFKRDADNENISQQDAEDLVGVYGTDSDTRTALDEFKQARGERIVFWQYPLWLRSDDFTVKLFNLLSKGSMSGGTTFAHVYPDFPEWVFYSGNAVQHESLPVPIRDEDGDGWANGLAVDSAWWQTKDIEGRYRKEPITRENSNPNYEPLTFRIRPEHKLLGMRVTLKPLVADRGKKIAPYYRFRSTQFRVVGNVGDKAAQFVPQLIGGADPKIGQALRIVEPDSNFTISGTGNAEVDLYFEVPDGFTPRFVEFKRHARVAVNPGQIREDGPTGRLAAQPTGNNSGSGSAGNVQGLTSFLNTVIYEGTGEVKKLPSALAANRIGGDVELRDGKFASGRIMGALSALRAMPNTVTEFDVPGDKRIFQLQSHAKQAQSLAGQVFNFAGSVVNNYFALSNTGDRYPLCGYYALVERDGEKYLELFYTPDPGATGYNSMLDFKTDGIRKALRDQADAVIGLIFLVPPGTEITGLRTGTSTTEFGRGWTMSR